MIFAITIASTSFSISDLLFTKVSIEENERKSMFAVLYLSDRVKEYYIKKIQERYGRDAQRIVSSLLKLFNDDLDIVVNFFEGNISEEEKERFLQTVNACGDEKLIKFVNSFSEEDVSDVRETTEEKRESGDAIKLLNAQQSKENHKKMIALAFAAIGLTALLIILTARVSVNTTITNALTIIAFIAVIVGLMLKEYYRAHSLAELAKKKQSLFKELQNSNNQ